MKKKLVFVLLGDEKKRLYKQSTKVEPSRGFVSAKSKVPASKKRHFDGTGSESNLLEEISYRFDRPIHKSTSEWVLSSSPEEARNQFNKTGFAPVVDVIKLFLEEI